jgi:hypothetical protein
MHNTEEELRESWTLEINFTGHVSQTLLDIPEMNCFLYSELVPRTEKNFCFKFFGVCPIKARTFELPFPSPLIIIAII